MTAQPDAQGAETLPVRVTVNGVVHDRTVPVRMTMSDFIRHELLLTGTHVGCEHGACGACTILVEGRSARACLMLAVQSDGATVTTIEGLTPGPGRLSALQEAFRDRHGLQCGFCTPGMLTTLTELLADNPDPTEDDVRLAISGNLCRCTGYDTIVQATLDAASVLRLGAPS